MEKVLDAPTHPDLQHLSRSDLKARLWMSFGGPVPVRPWAGPISDIYFGWMSLGRDVNGVTLHSERESWLMGNGWSEDGDKEAGHFFFHVLENESAEIHHILYPAPGK